MDQDRPAVAKFEDFVPPSRLSALGACRGALDLGPVLLTGAPGVGKTHLTHRLAAEGRFAWVTVDVAPGMSPSEFWRLVLASLRVRDVPGSPRQVLADSLSERSADGVRMGLIVDEAHGASDEILEDLRLQTNRLGRPDGFAAIVISGQSPLARRLESRQLEGLESRLAGRVHLLPLDARETRMWVEHRRSHQEFTHDDIEDLARESGGIPARLDRALKLWAPRSPARSESALPPSANTATLAGAITEPAAIELAPAILPSKPPLRVEDGMIEVGWDAEPDTTDESDDAEVQVHPDGLLSGAEHEPVDDHYAALQAWEEWVKNQGRKAASSAIPPDPLEDELPMDEDLEAEDESPLAGTPGVWAEGRHGFGPYSQLFSRSKPLKEVE